ncbi:hypothetical protein GX48_05842 [Paracoccidioides brasiliensis]|nr:hypothetical protein GX48_05842 [Paracoccidioides brasiliensis]
MSRVMMNIAKEKLEDLWPEKGISYEALMTELKEVKVHTMWRYLKNRVVCRSRRIVVFSIRWVTLQGQNSRRSGLRVSLLCPYRLVNLVLWVVPVLRDSNEDEAAENCRKGKQIWDLWRTNNNILIHQRWIEEIGK